MDLFKALIGKNPAEFQPAADSLVSGCDIELFKKLVEQDDFLFDFVKNNVAKRILNACNKDNYKNILSFFKYYSESYAKVFAEVLLRFGDENLWREIKNLYFSGIDDEKIYSAVFLYQMEFDFLQDIKDEIRINSKSENQALAIHSIELLSKLKDDVSREEAIKQLSSSDEFEQYNAVKFLVTYKDTGSLDKIIDVMKNSSLSENIASEIPYLLPLEELIKTNIDNAMLVLCNIVSGIPDIIAIEGVLDYNLMDNFENLYNANLTSSSALLLRLAKEKFSEITSNEEYLFDCDKNTKDEVFALASFLQKINNKKLESFYYDELFAESDFIFFALDFVKDVAILESLLDSENETLVLKVLTILKENNFLTNSHKELALKNLKNTNIIQIVEVM